MKLSKQERIGALIVLAIVILGLGAFLLIKPKIESAFATQNTLVSKAAELKQAQEKAERKKPLRAEIEAAYQEGEHLADMFFPELTSYEADNAFREFIKQCNLPVVVEQITVAEPNTSTLGVTFYTPSEVTYALKTYVSQGADSSSDDDPVNARRMAALETALAGTQTIGSSSVDFTVSALTQEDIIKFVDAVNNYFIKEGEPKSEDDKGIRKAVQISTLTVPYDELNHIYEEYIERSSDVMEAAGGAARNEIAAKKQNPDVQQNPGEAPEEREILTIGAFEETLPYTFSDSFTFYSIERMQNPQDILDEQDGIVRDNDTPAE